MGKRCYCCHHSYHSSWQYKDGQILLSSTFVTILSPVVLEQKKKGRNLMTVSQDVLVQFGRDNVMVGIAGYYVAPEGTQHVIVGFRDGTLTEVYWKTGQGVHQDALTSFTSSFTFGGISGYYVPTEDTQHVIVGTNDNHLTEGYWKTGQGVHQDVLASFPDGIGAVGGYFVAGENAQHAIVGSFDGRLIELYW